MSEEKQVSAKVNGVHYALSVLFLSITLSLIATVFNGGFGVVPATFFCVVFVFLLCVAEKGYREEKGGCESGRGK